MGALVHDEPWIVLPDPDNEGMDRIMQHARVVGKILWLRELRYPAMCRIRMSAALNGAYVPQPGVSSPWTSEGAEKVWLLAHNGAVIAELHSSAPGSSAEFIRDGVLAGLNMRPGRRPEACEPMPITPVVERHLKLVR